MALTKHAKPALSPVISQWNVTWTPPCGTRLLGLMMEVKGIANAVVFVDGESVWRGSVGTGPNADAMTYIDLSDDSIASTYVTLTLDSPSKFKLYDFAAHFDQDFDQDSANVLI